MLIYIGVYIVGNDTDANGKKIPHSDDTAVKVVNIIRFRTYNNKIHISYFCSINFNNRLEY